MVVTIPLMLDFYCQTWEGKNKGENSWKRLLSSHYISHAVFFFKGEGDKFGKRYCTEFLSRYAWWWYFSQKSLSVMPDDVTFWLSWLFEVETDLLSKSSCKEIESCNHAHDVNDEQYYWVLVNWSDFPTCLVVNTSFCSMIGFHAFIKSWPEIVLIDVVL